MKRVTITARAARFVGEYMKWFETQQGTGFVPLIMWQVGDSSNPQFVPQLTVGFERRDVVDRSRIMECDGKDIEIFQYAPDELFGTDGQKVVDLTDNMLVIVDTNDSAS
jgi:hypothetical protein